MRTLIVSHYFPPEIGAPQARLSDLARFWAEDDHVTVLTGMPNHPTGIVPPEYRRKLRVEEHSDGYRVLRTWLYATRNEGFAKKTVGHLSFMVTSVLLGLRKSGPADAVVVSSPTFFSIFSGLVLAKAKRAKLVVEIRDLWPAIFVELGVITNRPLILLLERTELWLYHMADEVVVVSEGFRDDLVRRGVPETKVHTIRNGVDTKRFVPGADSGPGRTRLGVTDEETLVLYIGAHGISHGLDTVVDAAARLEGQTIRFVFIGEGAKKLELERQVKEHGLTNVDMFPGVPRDEVAELLAAADICLVPLRDVPLFSTFIPSKIFEYFAAGKAVIGAVRGEPAQILRDGGALVVEPGNPESLADAVSDLAGDPEQRDAMAKQARTYVEAEFDRPRLAQDYRTILHNVVGR